MRFENVAAKVGFGLCLVVASATPASAQTLFQSLFGLGNSSQRAPDVMRPQGRPYLPARRFLQHRSHRSQAPVASASEPQVEEIGPPDSGGPYRTMCVRTCDGFYFPIRHDAQQRNFSSDVKSCQASCGGEAKLFYFPEIGGSVDTMIDLAGHKYGELPHAFAYRKKLIAGCTCKPAPWSAEETGRHQGYAFAEAAQKAAEVSRAAAITINAEEHAAKRAPNVVANAEPPAASIAPAPETFEPIRPEPAQRRRESRNYRATNYANGAYHSVTPAAWSRPSRLKVYWRPR